MARSRRRKAADSIFCFISGHDLILSDTVITVVESSVDVAEDYLMLYNYPNPFNPHTVISYNVYESADVKMSIYDIQGKLVKVLVDAWREAGTYKLKLDGTHMASGEYICNFQIGEKQYNRKLLLLK